MGSFESLWGGESAAAAGSCWGSLGRSKMTLKILKKFHLFQNFENFPAFQMVIFRCLLIEFMSSGGHSNAYGVGNQLVQLGAAGEA